MPIAPDTLTGTLRSDLVASQKIPVYMDDYIAFEDESAYRFESLARRLNGSQEVENTKVEFMEMGLYPNVMEVTEAAASGTTISVDHPEYAHQDQLIYNTRTNEIYLMNEATGGITAAGKITVVNHSGSGNFTTACVVGDKLIILPEAHAEGEAVPSGWSSKPRFLYTYVQQSDMSCGPYTDIAKAQKEYGEKQLLINRKQKWIEWKRAVNLIMYLGQAMRDATSASGLRRHTMRGLRSWISSNRVDFSLVPGGFGLSAVGELMRKTSLIGASSNSKVGIAGQNAWVSLSALPNNAIRATQDETSWGWKVNRLVTPFGNLALEYDPTLSEMNGLGDVMCILDMAAIQLVHLTGLRERMYLDVTDARDIHNMEDLISGTFGLKVKLQERCAWGYGIN